MMLGLVTSRQGCCHALLAARTALGLFLAPSLTLHSPEQTQAQLLSAALFPQKIQVSQ